MRRKSTRAAAKASPEKVKEEKSPKKTRRHSKRHKPTSSESESEDEVSVSSNETPAPPAAELWTVTQTEQSTNDIGKIKICLARPNAATPERTERASKRLRNKPPAVEDSPSAEERTPTRRTRRSRGGSSPPVKREELPPQPDASDAADEKKGKGKSKGKHKSKTVEQAAPPHIVEHTEMQGELSENVQVTAQSPQNVDNSDAEIVERDLSAEPDANDNAVDNASHDISNNNVANNNDNQALPARESAEEQNDAENAGNVMMDETCNNTVGTLEVTDSDVSMMEVTHFEKNISVNESGTEETVAKGEDIKEEPQILQISKVEAKVEPELKTEKPSTEIKDETVVTKQEDIKTDLVTSKEELKSEDVDIKTEEPDELPPVETKVEVPQNEPENDEPAVSEDKCKREEIVESTKIEVEDEKIQPPKPEIVQKEELPVEQTTTEQPQKEEQPETHKELKTSPEEIKEELNSSLDEPEKITEDKSQDTDDTENLDNADNKEETLEPTIEETTETCKVQEPLEIQKESTETIEETTETCKVEEPSKPQMETTEMTETMEKTEEPAKEPPVEKTIKIVESQVETTQQDVDMSPQPLPKQGKLIRIRRKFEEHSPQEKSEVSEEIASPKEDSKSMECKEETSKDVSEEVKTAEPETEVVKQVNLRLWGETTTIPNLLLATSTRLLEMYPSLTLLDEASVKLEATPRERMRKQTAQRAQEAAALQAAKRRASKEEPSANDVRPRLEREESTTSTTSDSNSIALHRKISIVEDEASSLRPPPSPAKHEKSSVLFITNLVRPFTVKQLRGLLERTGKIVEDGFWTDKIKSKCYVQYETEEEAEMTRNAIHNVTWPIGNGKKLIIDFSTVEELENAKNPPVVVPPPAPVKKDTEKENQEPPKKTPAAVSSDENKTENASAQWDGKEIHLQRRRSLSVEHKRRLSSSRRSPSPEVKKKRREEPVPQRAMDDLFRKTEATPSIYWQPLMPEEIAIKQQQRLERMEAHKRKMEMQSRPRRKSDRQQRGGPYRRRY